jgi:hypothetical protein
VEENTHSVNFGAQLVEMTDTFNLLTWGEIGLISLIFLGIAIALKLPFLMLIAPQAWREYKERKMDKGAQEP